MNVLVDTVCTMDMFMKQMHLAKFLVKVVALHGAHKLIQAPALWFKCMQAGSTSHVTAYGDRSSREKVSVCIVTLTI